MRIDLHLHSTASDGTDTPEMLPSLAQQAGLDAMGLTDHDTVAGWEAASASASRIGISLVRGMELTTHFPMQRSENPHGHRRVSVHILGYLFNPKHPAIVAHIERMANAREERAREIVDRLSADYPISWDTVEEVCAPGAPIGRPHIADALVAAGVVEDRSAAFASLLAVGSKYYVPSISPMPVQAVECITAAGGKAVLAHPKAVKRGNFLPDFAIRELAQAGLFGIEVDHRDNPDVDRPSLCVLAHELGLKPFGASDYHGAGKPNRIGENVTSIESYAALIDGTFLEVIAA